MSAKPDKRAEYKEIIYSRARWALLKELREKAAQLMAVLETSHIQTVVHGSIVRGDVTTKSDIDIFIPEPPSSFLIEAALEKASVHINSRFLVQATPTYAMKGHIEIDEKTSVSFPLMSIRKVEREFYRFGGEANLDQLKKDIRISGVDKRLMLIEPTEKGHVETSITGKEDHVAKTLGISVETVFDRVHALLKRDRVGRTGVFVKKELGNEDTFELAMSKLAEENPAVRRRMRARSHSAG
jgi:predicted nucleotidyltransferase